MFYAVVVLTKLAVCAKSPESIVGAILDPGSLKTPEYLHRLIVVLTKAAGPESFSVSSTFLSILAKLAGWHHRLHIFSSGVDEFEEILVPMAYLKIEEDPVKTGHLATANSLDSMTDQESISSINAFPNEIQFYKPRPSDFEMVYGDLSRDFATLRDYNPTGELDHSVFPTLFSTESSQLNGQWSIDSFEPSLGMIKADLAESYIRYVYQFYKSTIKSLLLTTMGYRDLEIPILKLF
jgi:hypothetical protein